MAPSPLIRGILVLFRTSLGQLTFGWDLGQFVVGPAINGMAGHWNVQLMLGPVYFIVSFRRSPYGNSQATPVRRARQQPR